MIRDAVLKDMNSSWYPHWSTSGTYWSKENFGGRERRKEDTIQYHFLPTETFYSGC